MFYEARALQKMNKIKKYFTQGGNIYVEQKLLQHLDN